MIFLSLSFIQASTLSNSAIIGAKEIGIDSKILRLNGKFSLCRSSEPYSLLYFYQKQGLHLGENIFSGYQRKNPGFKPSLGRGLGIAGVRVALGFWDPHPPQTLPRGEDRRLAGLLPHHTMTSN